MLTEPFKVYEQYKQISGNYYAMLGRARKEGKLLAWGVVLLPAEILRSMDIEPVLGEPYSAACAASGLAPEFNEATSNYGLGRDFCSYSRNYIGSYLLNKGPIGEMPAPDVVVGCKTGCNDHIAWFETLSKITNKPFFSIDMPILYDDVKEYHIEYVQGQFEKFIEFLQRATGKKLEGKRFVEVVSRSHRSRELWTEILSYCRNIPTPLSFRNQLSFMMPAVSLRGTKEAVDFYIALLGEVKDRVKRKVAAVPEEKVRLLWDNIPPWYYMRLFGHIEERGAVVVVSPYVSLFGINPPISPSLSERGIELIRWKEPTNLKEALRELAKDFLRHQSFDNLPAKLRHYQQVVAEYHIQGAIFHSNRGCKNLSLNKFDVVNFLKDKLHIPLVVFEGSNADPRDFDEVGAVSKIDAFLEKVLPRAG